MIRTLKLKWKCLALVYCWWRRPFRPWSPQHCHSGECCTIHLFFPAASTRNCLCICADKGKGHFGKQQRWPGGRPLRRWRVHLYEEKIMTAEGVWAFLQAQSFHLLCDVIIASLSLYLSGEALSALWSLGWLQLWLLSANCPGCASFHRRVQQSCSFHH